MPQIDFEGQTITCERGANLRRVLLEHDLSPHNGNARWFNCKGFGTCGTCAVQIEGPVDPPEPTGREAWRLDFPPHEAGAGLRLACQCEVRGDLEVTKHEGFWGQEVEDGVG